MKFGDYPKAGSFDGVSGFRSYVQSLGLDMPCDDIVSGGPEFAARFAARIRRHEDRPSPRSAADGGLGLPDRRPAVGEHQAALAALRLERRQADLGRRGLRRAARRPGQSEAARHGASTARRISPACARSSSTRTRKRPAAKTISSSACSSPIPAASASRTTIPNSNPIIAYRHPLLDKKFGYPADRPVISDDEIKRLVEDFVIAAKRAEQCGFDFVDVKHCHGYLGARISERGRSAGALWRQSGKSYPLSARGRRRHPRRGAAASHRRALERGRFHAVQAGSGAFAAGRARPRRAGETSSCPIATLSAPIRTIRCAPI